MKSKFCIFIFATIFILTIPALAVAQLAGPDADSIQLTLNPKNPGANQSVKVTLTSYSIDIDRADIAWSINGKQMASGKGLKSFTFMTAGLGTKTTLEVLAVSEEGYPILKSLEFNPASVDLIFEAESYTPPFYRGKAYFPYQGKARVIAIPSFTDATGKQISSNTLVFNWKDGNGNMANSSGVGKNVLNYKGKVPIRTGVVSVEVSSLDKKYLAEGSINIEPRESMAILYENDPEYGVLYNKALGNQTNLNKAEITVVASPYYFNTLNPNDYNLKYEWNLNGKIINSGGNSVVLRSPSGGGGVAALSLQLSNTTDIFQFGSASLNINFGEAAKNLFGL